MRLCRELPAAKRQQCDLVHQPSLRLHREVTGVGLWDASDSLFDLTQAACQSALTTSNNQSAPQLISATVTYPTGGSSVVTTVVNNPASPTPRLAGAATQLFFYTQPGGAPGCPEPCPTTGRGGAGR